MNVRLGFGLNFIQKNHCVAVDEGVDSDFPNVVMGIADTVDRSMSVTEDGDKIMGVYACAAKSFLTPIYPLPTSIGKTYSFLSTGSLRLFT